MKRWKRLIPLPFLLLFFLVTLAEFVPIPYIPSWSRLALLTSDQAPVDVGDAAVSVHFIDAGQSDCTLVMAYGKILLIDTGDASAQRQVMGYLKSQGIESIDYLLLTHPHADHMGNMAEILKTYPVETVIMSRLPDELVPAGNSYQEMLRALTASGAKVEAAVPGNSYKLGEARLFILGPVSSFDNLNDSSIICKLIDSSEVSFLFPGDAEKNSEAAMLESRADLRATVLKAGHHGSSTSSTAGFLDAVNAEYVVISCGEDNSYGFPHDKTMDRLEERNMQIYRTDEEGSIVFKISSDKSIQVVTTK